RTAATHESMAIKIVPIALPARRKFQISNLLWRNTEADSLSWGRAFADVAFASRRRCSNRGCDDIFLWTESVDAPFVQYEDMVHGRYGAGAMCNHDGDAAAAANIENRP